jgi:hypothetical protein
MTLDTRVWDPDWLPCILCLRVIDCASWMMKGLAKLNHVAIHEDLELFDGRDLLIISNGPCSIG